jgi:hypothetical protein
MLKPRRFSRLLESRQRLLPYWVRLTGFSPKRPKSGRCRSKTDFPKTSTAYRTDSVGGAKFVPPTVRCIVGDGRSRSADGRRTAGRRHAEKMPTPRHQEWEVQPVHRLAILQYILYAYLNYIYMLYFILNI